MHLKLENCNQGPRRGGAGGAIALQVAGIYILWLRMVRKCKISGDTCFHNNQFLDFFFPFLKLLADSPGLTVKCIESLFAKKENKMN